MVSEKLSVNPNKLIIFFLTQNIKIVQILFLIQMLSLFLKMTWPKILMLFSNLICLWTNMSLQSLSHAFFNFVIFVVFTLISLNCRHKTLTNVYIYPHLDHGKSLIMHGLPKYFINHLQKIQNTTARIKLHALLAFLILQLFLNLYTGYQ